MSGKKFLVLLFGYTAYLLFGAAVFHYIELAREIARKQLDRKEEQEIYRILDDKLDNDTLEILIPQLETYCGKPFHIDPNMPDPYHWHFYNAVFFVITVVSTIGYGNLSPTSDFSRALMIFYALIGIPLNGILLKSLADYFGHFFLRARDKYRAHHHNGMSLAGSVLLYTSLGIFVFILSPSFLFMYFEDWSFVKSVYYAFVSLTTIGFGDLVAGQEARPEWDIPYTLYKMFLIIWLVFGLGYLFMVLGFITDAMRSKRMAKLSNSMKHTPTKLWHGMVHEMPHLFRRVFNELYLLKVKPVYHDDDTSLATLQMKDRCSSCPNLFWLDEAQPCRGPFLVALCPAQATGTPRKPSRQPCSRPRALSEVLPVRPLVRRRSETALARIDRRATFADASAPTEATLDPAELLHEFMNALMHWGSDEVYSTLHKTPGTALPGGGYQGFADADILSGEWGPLGASGQSQGPGYARQRAKSLAPFTAATNALGEARFGYGGLVDDDWDRDDSSTLPADEASARTDGPDHDGAPNNAEWTWSGAGASKRVHELIRARQNRRRSEAVIRRQQRQDRRLQELQDFERLQALEEMRQLAKEARQREKRLRTRTLSSDAADAGVGVAAPRPSVGGLMQRLAIPQRLKDLARRRSLQPERATSPVDEKRRSPSYDLTAPSWLSRPSLALPGDGKKPRTADRTASVGEDLHRAPSLATLGTGMERRDSRIFRRNSATVHPMLENVSLAEFLRVLQAVRQSGAAVPTPATPGKTRKLGTAGLEANSPAPNSIFSLFPGLLEGSKLDKRRSSLRPSVPSALNGAAPSTPGPRRRMSFWPSQGSEAAQASNGSAASLPPAGNGHPSGAPRRKSSAARRLSTFFGGGTCTDPAPDPDSYDVPVKATKRRRFSIWPTLSVIGRGSGASKQDPADRPRDSLAAVEDGRGPTDSTSGHPVMPQITITYIGDSDRTPPPCPPPPPPPAFRESLRRTALTGRGRGVLSRQAHVPERPSPPSPMASPLEPFRRRALSETTRTRSDKPGETYSERL